MYKRGDAWYSDFWYKGERYKESHGPVSKTIGKEKDRALRTDVASGKYTKKQNDPAFSTAIEEHLKKSKAENQPSTYKRNLLSAEYLKEHFKDKRISSIESNEILMRKYVNKRKEQIKEKQLKQGRDVTEITYTTINRELALLRAMFNVLIKANKAVKNPVSLVTLFEEVERERILSYEEENKIFQAIEDADKRYYHLKDMITVALHTAMREGEIFSMRKSWINLKENIINVPRHAQKRKKKDKRVPVNSVIRPILKRLLMENIDSEYIFVNPMTDTKYTSVNNAWNGILKKAGLEGKPGVDKLRFHDLRHTAATNLARKAGKDIKFIAQYLGHSDVKTTARYIHYSDEDLQEGAESLVRVPPDFTPLKSVKP
jgi:integrase